MMCSSMFSSATDNSRVESETSSTVSARAGAATEAAAPMPATSSVPGVSTSTSPAPSSARGSPISTYAGPPPGRRPTRPATPAATWLSATGVRSTATASTVPVGCPGAGGGACATAAVGASACRTTVGRTVVRPSPTGQAGALMIALIS